VLSHRLKQLAGQRGAWDIIRQDRIDAAARTQCRLTLSTPICAFGRIYPLRDLGRSKSRLAIEAPTLDTPLDSVAMIARVPVDSFEVSAIVGQDIISTRSGLTDRASAAATP